MDDFIVALREVATLTTATDVYGSRVVSGRTGVQPVSGISRLVGDMLDGRKQGIQQLEHLGSALQHIGRGALKATAGLFGYVEWLSVTALREHC